MSDYCSEIAHATGATLAGTAAQAEVWILLEYRGTWRANATEDNELSAEIQTWLTTQTAQIANSRVVFIRRPSQFNALHCYVAVTREHDQRLYRFTFAEYHALTQIDIRAVVAGTSDVSLCEEKLVLVCTNGKRDRCCATFGRPVYAAFARETGLSVWQATHLGGHRYAAVAAIFPAGIYYGYLNPETVPAVAATVRNQTVHLPAYRGRVYYSGVVSAGDCFLRQATGVEAVEVISAEITPQNQHRITYRSADDQYTLLLDAAISDPVLVGCTANKLKPQPVYTLRQLVQIAK